MSISSLISQIIAPFKGVLAADETPDSLKKHFDKFNIPSTSETRCAWRSMLVTTPGIENYIGGVILQEETLGQTVEGRDQKFPEFLTQKGITPGIKVDQGLVERIDGFHTKGLEDLVSFRETLRLYKDQGAQFTKWRSLIRVGAPHANIQENMETLARYARAVLDMGLLPIVEPEVYAEGFHSLSQARETMIRTLAWFFGLMDDSEIPSHLLKPSFLTPGLNGGGGDPGEMAAETLAVLQETTPPSLGGVVFLSGGLSSAVSFDVLDRVNKLAHARQAPWRLSFSFGRALEQPALEAWKEQDVESAQEVFAETAQKAGLASEGKLS